MKIRLLRTAFFVCISWVLYAQTTPKQRVTPAAGRSTPDNKGSLIGNVYKNPVLDLTLPLTGVWEFLDQQTTREAEGMEEAEAQTGKRSDCRKPLCGNPEINVALRSKTAVPSADEANTIFLAGFKLEPRYLDRTKYPLIEFADLLLSNSLDNTNPVPVDKFTAIQLGGKPAYRLLVYDPETETKHEAGYVVESNGYILLFVGAAPSADELPKLQSAIEGLQFTPATQ